MSRYYFDIRDGEDFAEDDEGIELQGNLAPKFYPILSSLRPLDLPGWAVVATGAGAEPST